MYICICIPFVCLESFRLPLKLPRFLFDTRAILHSICHYQEFLWCISLSVGVCARMCVCVCVVAYVWLRSCVILFRFARFWWFSMILCFSIRSSLFFWTQRRIGCGIQKFYSFEIRFLSRTHMCVWARFCLSHIDESADIQKGIVDSAQVLLALHTNFSLSLWQQRANRTAFAMWCDVMWVLGENLRWLHFKV